MFAVVAAFASQVPKITFDMTVTGMLHENDPTRIACNRFQAQFGLEDALIIALRPQEVFSQKFVGKLKTLHEELEENVPYINKITSMVNARDTRGSEDQLIVEDLLENLPKDEAQMAALKDRVMGNPMYQNIIISEDASLTKIVIQLDSRNKTDDSDFMDSFEESDNGHDYHSDNNNDIPTLSNQESSEVTIAAQKVLDKYRGDGFIVYVTGGPALNHYLIRGFAEDISKFMIIGLFVIGAFLFIMFRRISGVILPFIVVISALVSTVGIMAITGVPFSAATQILPSFLLAVGVGGSVHILAIFYQHFQKSNNKKASIVYALGHSGIPVVMTNVTTACGLLSFSSAELLPICHLGQTGALGVMLSLAFTVILLPAIVAVIPFKNKQLDKTASKTTISNILYAIGNFSTDHPGKILLLCTALTVLSLFNAKKIIFSHDTLRWFPKDSYIRQTTETLDREMGGSVNLEIVVDTGKENGFYDPELLIRVEEAKEHIEKMTYKNIAVVGKALTLPMILKEINQALNENNPDYYTVPKDKDLVAQEFLLFENSGVDDLEDFTDSNFTKGRMALIIPFLDAIDYNNFLDTLEKYLHKQFAGEKVTITGQSVMMAKTLTAGIISMKRSYIYALVVITFLMIILLGDLRTGLLSMIPNVFPIMLMLGMMGLFKLPMNIFSMLVGSIAMGLAVDDTIHFMHNFKKYYDETDDPKEAVNLTLQSTGRAMIVTTIVLSMGFFIYMFGTMKNTFDFGLLTGFAVSMALLADFFLAPALMMVTNRTKKTKYQDVIRLIKKHKVREISPAVSIWKQ